MIPPFDIFKVDEAGSVIWIQDVIDLETAKARVQELMKASPSEYLIHSQITGNRTSIKPEKSNRGLAPSPAVVETLKPPMNTNHRRQGSADEQRRE